MHQSLDNSFVNGESKVESIQLIRNQFSALLWPWFDVTFSDVSSMLQLIHPSIFGTNLHFCAVFRYRNIWPCCTCKRATPERIFCIESDEDMRHHQAEANTAREK